VDVLDGSGRERGFELRAVQRSHVRRRERLELEISQEKTSSRQLGEIEILPTRPRVTSSVHPICRGLYKNGLHMAAPFLQRDV
jgi:hypothetical protein